MSFLEQKQNIEDFGRWIPEEDNDCLMIKCPSCNGRVIVGSYCYRISYKFCPYCGDQLINDSLFDILEDHYNRKYVWFM